MAQDHDGAPWFCSHCEWEMDTEPYLRHIKACLDMHIASWPRHQINAQGLMELCGKPHIPANSNPDEEFSKYLRHLDWMSSGAYV